MTHKTVYQLDAHSFFACETQAFESPLEEGVFHLPAGCVEVPPPVAADGERARWVADRWVLEPWSPPVPTPEPTPAEKLAAFLEANPDVMALFTPKA